MHGCLLTPSILTFLYYLDFSLVFCLSASWIFDCSDIYIPIHLFGTWTGEAEGVFKASWSFMLDTDFGHTLLYIEEENIALFPLQLYS